MKDHNEDLSQPQSTTDAYKVCTNFPYTILNPRQRISTITKQRSIPRMPLACVVITFAAYWAGARWGQRQPIGVSALQRGGSAPKDLSAVNIPTPSAAPTD